MAQKIPNKLGKYTVKAEISRGSMGIVYLGHDPYINRPVAIKVALEDSLKDQASAEELRKMFFNEAHTAGLLTHPNIIGIYDAGVDEETCYIVMEYIEGGDTLKSFTKPDLLLPLEKVVEIVFKCAKALDYAHRQGIVHRDIKPSNILFTKDMDVKIGDFSIAHINQPDATQSKPMGMVGSPKYMSPQQLTEEYVTNQTDLYSLGVIMYELLTGKHPFEADNFSRLVNKIINEEAPSIREIHADISEALEKIVVKAMQKNHIKRSLLKNLQSRRHYDQ